MKALFNNFFAAAIRPIFALNEALDKIDAKIVSQEGNEVLHDVDKMKKVEEAVKKSSKKSNSKDISENSHMIFVDLG